ncbi:Tautomerase/MIF [Amanita rubescens]|nr:Tautomerase/MIF [Amanita rubescens]
MPYLNLITNVKIADPKAFVLEFTKLGAKVLGKPEGLMCASYTYNETMAYAGTFEPAFQLFITSVGNLNPQANITYTSKISAFLKEKLGLADDRGYIFFSDPGAENTGYKSSTIVLPS